jgi:signal transduction histidine kinase
VRHAEASAPARPRLIRGFVDAYPAVLIGGFGLLEIWGGTVLEPGFTGDRPLHTVALVLYTAPLAWRRRAPAGALLLMLVGFALEWVQLRETGQLSAEAFLALLIAVFSLGLHARDRRRAVAALTVVIGVLLTGDTADVIAGHVAAGDSAALYVLLIGAWLAGDTIRRRSLRAAALAERAGQLERERDERARAAVLEERLRIARELHDIVAHTVTVMVVEAAAARHVLRSDPDAAEAQLVSAERTGREAVAEVRRLLGLLRGGDQSRGLTPQPGISDIEQLADQSCDAGLAVDVSVEGEPTHVPAGADLAAFRIVQEALTNVRKHAGATRVDVTLRFRAGELEIDIADDGRGPSGRDGWTGGHGLIGMRERIAMYGGTLKIDRAERGGFRLRAWLPLARSPS